MRSKFAIAKITTNDDGELSSLQGMTGFYHTWDDAENSIMKAYKDDLLNGQEFAVMEIVSTCTMKFTNTER